MNKSNIDVHVCVNGNKVAEYLQDSRCYVEAKLGTEYSIRVKNNNPFRTKVVVSVDGVNVVSGKPATDSKEEAGYVLDAHQSYDIKGYRLSDNDVSAFKFVEAAAGYAQSEKKMSGTTGIIGVRTYREKEKEKKAEPRVIHHYHNNYYDNWYGPYYTPRRQATILENYPNFTFTCNNSATYGSSSASTQASSKSLGEKVLRCCTMNASRTAFSEASAVTDAVAEQSVFDTGSTFGQKLESTVTSTTFDAYLLISEIEIYYAQKAGLEKLGIDMSKKPKVTFPAAFSGNYAVPPVGWKG